jgi:hypothetical protein
MTFNYGGKLHAWGKKSRYLTFIKMLTIIITLLYTAIELDFYSVRSSSTPSYLHEEKYFFSR